MKEEGRRQVGGGRVKEVFVGEEGRLKEGRKFETKGRKVKEECK